MKPRRTNVTLLMTLLAVCSMWTGVCHAETEGYWEGVLSFSGSEMEIRIHIFSIGDSLQAELDIPSMLMAWEPVPAREVGETVEIEFPFGIGSLAIALNANNGSAEKMLGEQALRLTLERHKPPTFVREDVSCSSGGVQLAGTLVKPGSGGPYPAIVLLHVSGRQGRDTWTYRSWADLFVRHGFAVLYYDKRGVGDSGGEYPASLRQLADDGIAIVDYLHTRDDIDTSRIGLKGRSQGAWIAEQVAIDRGDIDFLVLTSAAADTPREQQLQSVEYGMRLDGVDEELIENALAYYGLYFYVARTGNGWAALEKAVKHAQSEEGNAWGQYVDQPRSIEDLDWWRENHDFNPGLSLGQLSIPAIIFYGAADFVTPPTENAMELKNRFGNPDNVSVHVFPGGDHRIELPMGEDEHGVWHWPTIAPELFPILTSWLEMVQTR